MTQPEHVHDLHGDPRRRVPGADQRRLALAAAAACGVAVLVLLTAILPAEYGIDPTGVGRSLGFTRLRESGLEGRALEPESDATILERASAQWVLEEILLLRQTGSVSPQQVQATVPVPIDLSNVTEVSARLDWVDDERINGKTTEPDLLELSMRAPGSTRRTQPLTGENQPGGAGSITVTLPWRSVPYPEENGTRIAFDAERDDSARGTWEAVVHLYEARGVPGESAADPGEDWTLTVIARTYRLDVVRLANVTGWDRVELVLPPGGLLEYKFFVEENRTFEYAWTATASLYYDFHGDRGDATDDFTRYRESRASSAEGRLVAPFTGRHGWFWQNFESSEVRITLETRGDYDIIGVV